MDVLVQTTTQGGGSELLWLIVLIAIAMLSGPLIAIFFILKSVRKQKRKIGKLADTLGASPTANGGSGEIDGVAYRYYHESGNRNKKGAFVVEFDCDTQTTVLLRPTNGFDRFFERLGVVLKIKSGDATFDGRVFVDAEHATFAQTLLQSATRREAVIQLLDLGFTVVRFDHKRQRLLISKTPFNPSSDIEAETIRNVVAMSAPLLKDLPPLIDTPRFIRKSSGKAPRIAIFVVITLLLVLGIGGIVTASLFFVPLDVGTILLDSLLYSVPALIFFVFLATRVLSGRTTSHKELAVALALALAAFPVAGYGIGATLNGWLDTSQPQKHSVMVWKKSYTRNKNSYTYYLHVQSWRPNHRLEKIKVYSDMYRRSQPRQSRLTVTVRAGRFGYVWLQDYSLQP